MVALKKGYIEMFLNKKKQLMESSFFSLSWPLLPHNYTLTSKHNPLNACSGNIRVSLALDAFRTPPFLFCPNNKARVLCILVGLGKRELFAVRRSNNSRPFRPNVASLYISVGQFIRPKCNVLFLCTNVSVAVDFWRVQVSCLPVHYDGNVGQMSIARTDRVPDSESGLWNSSCRFDFITQHTGLVHSQLDNESKICLVSCFYLVFLF